MSGSTFPSTFKIVFVVTLLCACASDPVIAPANEFPKTTFEVQFSEEFSKSGVGFWLKPSTTKEVVGKGCVGFAMSLAELGYVICMGLFGVPVILGEMAYEKGFDTKITNDLTRSSFKSLKLLADKDFDLNFKSELEGVLLSVSESFSLESEGRRTVIELKEIEYIQYGDWDSDVMDMFSLKVSLCAQYIDGGSRKYGPCYSHESAERGVEDLIENDAEIAVKGIRSALEEVLSEVLFFLSGLPPKANEDEIESN